MPETRPQHTFTVRYKVIGRSLNDQLADIANEDHPHEWVDITTIDQFDYQWICSGCGTTKTVPRAHWPLYPEDT